MQDRLPSTHCSHRGELLELLCGVLQEQCSQSRFAPAFQLLAVSGSSMVDIQHNDSAGLQPGSEGAHHRSRKYDKFASLCGWLCLPSLSLLPSLDPFVVPRHQGEQNLRRVCCSFASRRRCAVFHRFRLLCTTLLQGKNGQEVGAKDASWQHGRQHGTTCSWHLLCWLVILSLTGTCLLLCDRSKNHTAQ
jgi:hypothetical protein